MMIKKMTAGLMAVVLMFSSLSATCFAASAESIGESNTETTTIENNNTEESDTETADTVDTEQTGTALTPSGNLTLVDDIGSTTGAGQQFITLVTKNGNTFYLVIDRDDDGNENVHFMNLVDEADLFALMDEDQVAEYQATQGTAGTEDTEPESSTEDTSEDIEQDNVSEPEVTEKKSVNVLPIAFVLIVFAACGGGYFYLQTEKKKAAEQKPDPDADYRDKDEEEYDIPEEDDYEDDETDAEKYPEDEPAEVSDDSKEDE